MKDPIHIGDTVRIVNPTFFIRCGYDITRQDIEYKLFEETNLHAKINEIGSSLHKYLKDDFKTSGPQHWDSESFYRNIIHYLAKAKIEHIKSVEKNLERKIFTIEAPDQKGVVCQVIGKQTCVTGTYSRGGFNNSWDYDEYDPPGLYNAKTHVILNTNIRATGYAHYIGHIEVINVEKVIDLKGVIEGFINKKPMTAPDLYKMMEKKGHNPDEVSQAVVDLLEDGKVRLGQQGTITTEGIRRRSVS